MAPAPDFKKSGTLKLDDELGWRWEKSRWEFRVGYPGYPRFWCVAGTIEPLRGGGFAWHREKNEKCGVLPGEGVTESFTEAQSHIDISYEYEASYAG